MRPFARQFAARRGATLLEVVLAAVILGLVAVAVTGAITFITRADLWNQRRLGGYEVANRLILQYLDEKKLMPSSAVPYDDGRFLYRWELTEEPLEYELPEGSMLQAPANWAPGLSAIRETKLVRVRVYMGVPDGIGGASRGELLAELARPHNPLMLLQRNPDARNRLIRDPAGIEMFRLMMSNSGGQPGPGAPGTGSTPPPGSPAAPPPTTGGTRP